MIIRKIKTTEEDFLKKIIFKKKYINPYIYIDSNNDGFDSINVKTYILENRNRIKVILYDYYNSIQLLTLGKISNSAAIIISNFLINNNYKRVSGDKKTIKKISSVNNKFRYSSETTMIFKKSVNIKCPTNIFKMDEKNIHDIVKFLMKCDQWKSSYSYESLTNQLYDRLQKYNCNLYFIKNDSEICSVFGEYGKFMKLAVLGGMYTGEKYRNKGYASLLVNHVIQVNVSNNIVPIIYVVDNRLIKWYKKFGFKKLYNVAKLEYKNLD